MWTALEQYLLYGAAIFAALLLLRIMALPIRLVFKLLINTACGCALLFLFNAFSEATGFTMPINLVTAAAVGLLGLPGFGLLLMVRFLLLH